MKDRLEQPAEVVVVGDGIVGRCIARALAKRGVRVDIIDAGLNQSSTAAAGMLSPLPETNPGSPFQAACLSARDYWHGWGDDLAEETGTDLEISTAASIFPSYDLEDQGHIDTLLKRALAAGEKAEQLSAEQLYELVPHLAKGAQGALLLDNEAHVDPKQIMLALDASLKSHGVFTHRQRAVDEVVASGSAVRLEGSDWSLETDTVIFAAGAWCSRIKGLGLDDLVYPVRGQMIAFKWDRPWDAGALRRGNYYALSRQGEVLFGATQERAGYDDTTTPLATQELRDAAEALLPKLAWRKVSRQWSGLRPASVDDLPIIGPLQSKNVLVATGTFRNGILLAPWISGIVAELVVSGEAEDLPRALAASRFA